MDSANASSLQMRPTLRLALFLLTAGAVLTMAGPAAALDLEDAEVLQRLRAEAPTLNPRVLRQALQAADCADQGEAGQEDLLTVIDYSLPSTERRLWVFDLRRKELLFHELVAHGVNTGENLATRFSNREGSRQSSLGLFRTDTTYYGRNGYSLRLHGLEEGINHKALERTIVMHGAWYVTETFAQENGRLGRSWGCPAVEKRVARPLIDTIKNGSLLFVYYPDERWQRSSTFLNGCRQDSRAALVAGR